MVAVDVEYYLETKVAVIVQHNANYWTEVIPVHFTLKDPNMKIALVELPARERQASLPCWRKCSRESQW